LFTVGVETQFKASHSMPLPDGTKGPEHEHFWAVEAEVCSDTPAEGGVIIYFAQVKSRLTNVISALNETVLDDAECFQGKVASAENVAAYIFEHLEPVLPQGVRLKSISVSEQVGCWGTYSKE
jgi:6-pyruvoyl-tetrahydropterin synthase